MSTPEERRTIYSSRKWRRLRDIKLDDKPLCELCQVQGLIVAATIVHHKHAIRSGGELFPDDLDQLQSLCQACHQEQHSDRGATLTGDAAEFYELFLEQTEGSNK